MDSQYDVDREESAHIKHINQCIEIIEEIEANHKGLSDEKFLNQKEKYKIALQYMHMLETPWKFKYLDGQNGGRGSSLRMNLANNDLVKYNTLLDQIARNDKTPFPGFDQDAYVPYSNASNRTKKDLIEEYKAVRDSTISLFNSFDEESIKRIGTASGSKMSVRALGFIISGHQAHHIRIIEERYLS